MRKDVLMSFLSVLNLKCWHDVEQVTTLMFPHTCGQLSAEFWKCRVHVLPSMGARDAHARVPQKVVREYSLHRDQNVLSCREVFLAPLLKTCDALLLPCLFRVGTFYKVCAVVWNIHSRSVPSMEVFPQMAVSVLSSVSLLSWH